MFFEIYLQATDNLLEPKNVGLLKEKKRIVRLNLSPAGQLLKHRN